MNNSELEMVCETCQRQSSKAPVIGVAAVPLIPYSAAYCKECLSNGAHPRSLLRFNVAMCGGVDGVSPDYLDSMVVYYDGKYLTLREDIQERPLDYEMDIILAEDKDKPGNEQEDQ